jgi:hypothetical protein
MVLCVYEFYKKKKKKKKKRLEGREKKNLSPCIHFKGFAKQRK